MAETFKFNWQEEPEGFLKWLIPTVIPKGFEDFDELSKATDKFRNIELKISVNGFEMDAKHLLERVDENMQWYAKQEAARMLSEVGGFNDLCERLEQAKENLLEDVKQSLRQHGIELPEWDD